MGPSALELFDQAVSSMDEERVTFGLPRWRSIRRLLLPLFLRIARASDVWRAESIGFWRTEHGRYWMPRLVFGRAGEGAPAIRVAIFAGVHGDEPAGVHALCDLVRALEVAPQVARQYEIHLYPMCNPTGYEDGTRHARSGHDLNRQFWRDSSEPEVALLEREIRRQKYDGIISLHSDDGSDGVYGFIGGATLTEHLLKPALAAAEVALPINQGDVIDGFHAVNGVICSGYDGILCGSPGSHPAPFEIVLESPALAPMHLQRSALVLAVMEILRHYRRLIAYAADL